MGRWSKHGQTYGHCRSKVGNKLDLVEKDPTARQVQPLPVSSPHLAKKNWKSLDIPQKHWKSGQFIVSLSICWGFVGNFGDNS